MRFLKAVFSLDLGICYYYIRYRYSHQTLNLYSGGYPMRKTLKMYMPSS